MLSRNDCFPVRRGNTNFETTQCEPSSLVIYLHAIRSIIPAPSVEGSVSMQPRTEWLDAVPGSVFDMSRFSQSPVNYHLFTSGTKDKRYANDIRCVLMATADFRA